MPPELRGRLWQLRLNHRLRRGPQRYNPGHLRQFVHRELDRPSQRPHAAEVRDRRGAQMPGLPVVGRHPFDGTAGARPHRAACLPRPPAQASHRQILRRPPIARASGAHPRPAGPARYARLPGRGKRGVLGPEIPPIDSLTRTTACAPSSIGTSSARSSPAISRTGPTVPIKPEPRISDDRSPRGSRMTHVLQPSSF
jgi:hypothetical protein